MWALEPTMWPKGRSMFLPLGTEEDEPPLRAQPGWEPTSGGRPEFFSRCTRGGLGLASCHLLGLVLPRRAHFRPRPSLCLGYVYVPCLDGLCPDLAETPVSCGPFSWQEQHASTPILEPSPVWLLRGGAVGTRRFQSLDEARVLSLFSLLQLMIFNVGATLLYITAFITCSASVELTSLKGTRRYNQQAAASVSMASWGAPDSERGDGPNRGLCPWTPPVHPGLRQVPTTC